MDGLAVGEQHDTKIAAKARGVAPQTDSTICLHLATYRMPDDSPDFDRIELVTPGKYVESKISRAPERRWREPLRFVVGHEVAVSIEISTAWNSLLELVAIGGATPDDPARGRCREVGRQQPGAALGVL